MQLSLFASAVAHLPLYIGWHGSFFCMDMQLIFSLLGVSEHFNDQINRLRVLKGYERSHWPLELFRITIFFDLLFEFHLLIKLLLLDGLASLVKL